MDDIDLLKLNPFVFNENDNYIACVGNNGGTDDVSILMGFRSTALLIIDNITNGNGTEDELIYPLVFAIRHSVELALKIILCDLSRISHIKGIQFPIGESDLHTHDIEELSGFVKTLYSLDRRLSDLVELSLQYVSDYFFDKKADIFRYEKDLDGNESLKLVNIEQISIETLEKKYSRMMDLLENAINNIHLMVEEYSIGTFTRDLSRDDILQISQKLMPISEWKKEEFDACRDSIKKEYGIGGNKLSAVIKLIKSHPLFSSNIGSEIALGHITEGEIHVYAELLEYQRSVTVETNSCQAGMGLHELLIQIPEKEKQRSKIAQQISDEALYTIAAFGDMSVCRDCYCERFQKHYDHFANDTDIKRDWLIRKISHEGYLGHVLRGMEWCGQTTLLRLIKEECNK